MIANNIESEFVANDITSIDDPDEKASKESTVFDGKTLQSIKSLCDHKLKLPGRNYKDGTDIEESARFGNVETFREGLYFDDVLSTPIVRYCILSISILLYSSIAILVLHYYSIVTCMNLLLS
jgi:hypothetical protein